MLLQKKKADTSVLDLSGSSVVYIFIPASLVFFLFFFLPSVSYAKQTFGSPLVASTKKQKLLFFVYGSHIQNNNVVLLYCFLATLLLFFFLPSVNFASTKKEGKSKEGV